MSTMAAALEKAGFNKADMEAYATAVKFLKSGGTEDRWLSVFRRAAASISREGQKSPVKKDHEGYADATNPIPTEGQVPSVQSNHNRSADGGNPMPGENQMHLAREGQQTGADARRPMLDQGQPRDARNGRLNIAEVKHPIASGRGHLDSAKGQPLTASPAREPSEAYLRAAAQSRLETARTALYLHKTSDGRWWGDVHPREFAGMMRDGKIAEACTRVFGPFSAKQMGMKLGELLNDKQQKRVWELANE